MAFLKNIKAMFKSKNSSNILIVLAIVAVVYVVMDYERIKSSLGLDSMANKHAEKEGTAPAMNNYKPSVADEPTEASVNGMNTDMKALPASCASKKISNPKDLLPADGNTEFSKMNPSGSGDLMNVNLLRAGHHIGINTVGTSLRNANLQVRSEPPNPRLNTGPWNTSTITADTHRRPLEIGSSA